MLNIQRVHVQLYFFLSFDQKSHLLPANISKVPILRFDHLTNNTQTGHHISRSVRPIALSLHLHLILSLSGVSLLAARTILKHIAWLKNDLFTLEAELLAGRAWE